MEKIYKFGGWVGVVGVTSFLFWYSIYSWLNGSEVLSYGNYNFGSIVVGALFLAIMPLGFALFRAYWEALIGLVSASLGFLLGAGFSNLNLIMAGVIILLGFYSRMNVTHEIDQRIKIGSRAVIGAGLMPLIIAVALAISVIGYQSGPLVALAQQERVPSASESFIKSLVSKLINDSVKVDTSGIRKNIVDTIPAVIDSELGPIFGPIIKMVGDDYIKQIAGKSIMQNMPTDEILKKNIINEATKSVLGNINATLKPYFKYAKIIGAASLFLILMSLSWIFYWLAILIGVLALIILRVTGFVKVEEREIKAEKMVV